VIESLTGMTSTIKRRIAREWLIFLSAIILGLFITYGVFYLGRNNTWDYHAPPSYQDEDQRWLVQEREEKRFGLQGVHRYFAKPKNPGDFFDGLTSGVDAPSPYLRLPLWLCVLTPYFVFWFGRSVIWSVNALRRH
jgi:hypothetical protein